MSAKPAVLSELPTPITLTQAASFQMAIFAGAIFVSAFLLFQVQPLIGKFILPWFGGSPAVWTTCMLFFQVTLFLGYAYAHATSRWLSESMQRNVHLALIIASLIALPIAPNVAWKPANSEYPTLRILLLLAATVGLPYFVLSATGPLLQAWFSRVCPGRSPYRLYSLSNVGSLLALVTYPLIVEPLWPSRMQANVWSGLFLVFGLLCCVCAMWAGQISARSDFSGSNSRAEKAPSLLLRTLWLALPACSCLMLLATTNEVTQDVAPMPFLWVVPLGLYLLSFIICFDHETWYRRALVAPMTAVSLFLVAGLSDWPDRLGVSLTTTQELAFYFAALFGVCMVCHGEVVRLRPSPKYLTEFYLLLSAGGAVGGIFVSLIAPGIFTTYFEWSLCLLAAFVVAAVAGTMALYENFAGSGVSAKPRIRPSMRIGLLRTMVVAELLAFAQMAAWKFSFDDAAYRCRNFYGTLVVNDWKTDGNVPFRAFLSGHINHGRQWASVDKRQIPTTYYGHGTAPALAVTSLQSRPRMNIGVVGMGIGTLATYARNEDTVRFYEINPEVELIARKFFYFLSDCRGRCDVVVGDARLALEREQANRFDLLILDAFTSDAPPVHLLTREAFDQYVRHICDDGLLVVNVTNTYLELAPVVARLGSELGWKSVRIQTTGDADRLAYRTDYLVFARDPSLLPTGPTVEAISDDVVRSVPVWTDQYSNLFQVLRRD